MTVQAGPTDKRYAANGVSLAYTIPFLLIAASDLDVYLNGTLITTGFTITGAGNPTSTIIFDYAPLGDLYLVLDVPFERLIDYQENGDFLASTVNRDFDRIWQALKQLIRGAGRALTLGSTDIDGFGSYRGKNNRIQDIADPIAEQDVVNRRTLLTALADFSTDGSGQFVLEMLADTTGNTLGDTLLGVKQPFTGSASITQHDKNAQTIHINDFPPTPANTWLSRAIDGTPAGWTLQLGSGPYIAKFAKSRSDITIKGTGWPRRNAAKTALIGGTVIQGTFGLTGSSIHIRNLGVDCGQPVCDALNGGSGMDCLVLNDATRADLNSCTVFNCSSLAPHAGAAHGFLLEGCVDSQFGNLHSYGGLWGIVGKTQRSTFDGVYGYGCTQAGFTFKSDTGVAGALCLKSSAVNVYITDDGFSDCVTGILVYAASSSMADTQITNYIVDGCQTPLKVLCDSRAANVNLIQGLQLNNGILNRGTVTGYESFGACNDVQITNLRITGTTSGKSIQVGADNLGTSFDNVTASMPTALPTALNVNIAGRFTINDLRSVVNGDYATPAGINLVPDSAATFKIGAYLGTIGFSGVQTWTPSFTGLAIVNGTGGVTISGSYVIIGKMLKFRVTIATTGTATTASTASTTFINNLPFTVLSNDTLQALSGTVTQGGVGLVAQGGTLAYTPTWTAYNGTFTISGQYFFQV